jgi:hypothetical protein
MTEPNNNAITDNNSKDKILDYVFMSTNDTPIPDPMIEYEIKPTIRKFLKAIFHAEQQILNPEETKKDATIKKMKLLMDIYKIYKNPDYINELVKNHETIEKEKQLKRERELESQKNAERIRNLWNRTENNANPWNINNPNGWNFNISNREQISDDDSSEGEITESETDSDEVEYMLTENYNNIEELSSIRKLMTINRQLILPNITNDNITNNQNNQDRQSNQINQTSQDITSQMTNGK